eukprot:gnl/MRDRNA2_/MRDRNA2_93099_c0_seq1.p1 gnl/MRDRNA2_/MRDRNA2_93099_c0~~gnl/MRDRNA2_/MRDRNA2_93099_c0_seq1.p1  ORF type:complete len:351 (+),score=96.60 gnl/MRDRNA2_/MRDRNA2_93099_c0_seq1:74-1126(+)
MARDAALPALVASTDAGDSTQVRRLGSAPSSQQGGAADRERRLKLENSRLRDELDSLKAMYARRISTDARMFEEKIRLKDEECERWFRSKKTDIKKMQSALVIMRSLFERKRRKFGEDMQAQSEKFDKQKAAWIEDIRKLKAETEAEKAACRQELMEKTVEWQKKIQIANDEAQDRQIRVKTLEEALAEKKVECERLRKDYNELSRTMEQLKARLLEVERADELLKRNSQIEALEAELKRTKKMMHERAHAEADALRRELMEYVKFIVHILPEEWQAKNKEMAENPRSDGLPQPPRSAPATGTRGKNPRRQSTAQQAQSLYQVPSSLHGYAQALAPENANQHPEVDGDEF